VTTPPSNLQRKLRFSGAPIHVVAPSRWLAEKITGQPGRREMGRPRDLQPGWTPGDSVRCGREPDFRQSLGLATDKTLVLVVNREFPGRTKGSRCGGGDPRCRDKHSGENADRTASWLPPKCGRECRAVGYVSSAEKMAALCEAADLLLLPLRRKISPAPFSSDAAGCCVVATADRGVCEQLRQGSSGSSCREDEQAHVASVELRSA